jgi:hypothetical protein
MVGIGTKKPVAELRETGRLLDGDYRSIALFAMDRYMVRVSTDGD